MEMQKENMAAGPMVGEGATVHHYSDSAAYTVVAVTAKTATLQRDKAKLLNAVGSGEPDALGFAPGGFVGHTSGIQRYAYERDPAGGLVRVSLRKNGKWRTAGGKGEPVTFGVRKEHYDFNF